MPDLQSSPHPRSAVEPASSSAFPSPARRGRVARQGQERALFNPARSAARISVSCLLICGSAVGVRHPLPPLPGHPPPPSGGGESKRLHLLNRQARDRRVGHAQRGPPSDAKPPPAPRWAALRLAHPTISGHPRGEGKTLHALRRHCEEHAPNHPTPRSRHCEERSDVAIHEAVWIATSLRSSQ
jgi:hypothetical protein